MLPGLLSKPLSGADARQLARLTALLARLDLLQVVDQRTGLPGAHLGARYALEAADALHLATAVRHGADRVITDNRRDFDQDKITEIDVTYLDQV